MMNSERPAETITAPAPRGRHRYLKSGIFFVLTIAVIYFAARQFLSSWDEVRQYQWALNFDWLLLSVIGHLITLLCFAQIWCFLISGFGHRVSLKQAFKISYIASLGRYLPGRIWAIFGMAYLARRIGIKEEIALASWGIAMIFAIPSAFLTGAIGILIYPELLTEDLNLLIGGSLYAATGIIAIVSFLLVTAPNRMLALFNMLLRLLKRPVLTFRMSIGLALKVYIGYVVCWSAFGVSFWMFLRGILPDPSIPIVSGATAFVTAYQIGYLAIFTPGGLGVRELTMTGMLGQYVGAIAAGISLAARVWNLFVEFLAALIALTIRLPKKKTSAITPAAD